jgi:hypothetical protein
VLAVAGPAPVILEGVTGRDHALLMLECLALVPGSPAPDLDGLVERLTATALPDAPVLAVSTRPGGAGDLLAGRLHRRVTSLDLSAGQVYDFFERGSPRAT